MIKDTTTALAGAPVGHRRFPEFQIDGLTGTSFKPQHLDDILSDGPIKGFFEIHAENYMGAGGAPHRILETIRRENPLCIHGVCMSIGGRQPLDSAHLARFAALVNRYEPALVSEHLAWSTHNTTFFNDLLPLPYTKDTLDHVCAHVTEVQDAIGRQILIENPATYVTFSESSMSEVDFIAALAKRTGCGLLLDLNNVFISAHNHRYSSYDYIKDFPLSKVGEIHLAGHSVQIDDEGETVLIDSHNMPVANAVWQLYEHVVRLSGCIPTLIEWDGDIPEWAVLKAEAAAAQSILDQYTADISGKVRSYG